MKCPEPIAEILIDILKMAMLRIRLWGQQGEGRKCVYEADHVHNLPALLNNFRPELLAFYWNTERPLLMQQLPAADCVPYQPMWARLAELIPPSPSYAAVGDRAEGTSVGMPLPGETARR